MGVPVVPVGGCHNLALTFTMTQAASRPHHAGGAFGLLALEG